MDEELLQPDEITDLDEENTEIDLDVESIHSHPDTILETTSTVDDDLAEALSIAQSSEWSDASVWEALHADCMAILKNYEPLSAKDDTVRILRSFALRLPAEGQAILLSEFRQYGQSSEKLLLLRNHLVDAILRPMRKISMRNSIWEPIEDTAEDEIQDSLEDGFMSPSKRDDKARKEVLARDDWRCVVTGWQDIDAIRKHIDKGKRPKLETETTDTECAHIIPFQLREFKESNLIATKNKATIWYALRRYFPAVRDKIGPETINQYGNLVTLNVGLHSQYDKHKFSFGPHQDTNAYTIHKHHATEVFLGVPSVVRFETKNGLPVPDPAFLDLHHRVSLIMSDFTKHELKYQILKKPSLLSRLKGRK